MNSRLHAIVRGDVQGVFFRANCQQNAELLRLAGWVRNTPDGGVEVVAEGARSDLEKLLAWLRKGPPMSHVEKVDVEWGEGKGEFSDFRIRYGREE